MRPSQQMEYGRLQAEAVIESERLEQAANSREQISRVDHKLRSLLNTALLSFQTLRAGESGIRGSTGVVLGLSLAGLRDLIDRSLSEARLDAGAKRHDRVSLLPFVNEVTVAANLEAECRDIRLSVDRVGPDLAVTFKPAPPCLGGDDSAAKRLQVHARPWTGDAQDSF